MELVGIFRHKTILIRGKELVCDINLSPLQMQMHVFLLIFYNGLQTLILPITLQSHSLCVINECISFNLIFDSRNTGLKLWD